MKTVMQQFESDCGVACVAMLAGVSYDEARAAVYPDGKMRLTSSGKLRAALIKLGRTPVEGNMKAIGRKTLKSLPSDALLKVQPTSCSTKHWVVWDHAAQAKRDPYPLRHKVTHYLLVP